MTGLHPGEHGLVDEHSAFLPQSLTMLAEVLQAEGYSTAGWSTNYLVASNRNFDQGFERFKHAKGHSQASGEVMPEALQWLRSSAAYKFFLYLHLIDPHAPQDPLPEGRAALAANVPLDFSPTAINHYKSKLFGPTVVMSWDESIRTVACRPKNSALSKISTTPAFGAETIDWVNCSTNSIAWRSPTKPSSFTRRTTAKSCSNMDCLRTVIACIQN
ncbi:MAG: hypothetical protein ACI8TQ_001159 [Planctomycetota bacterium]